MPYPFQTKLWTGLPFWWKTFWPSIHFAQTYSKAIKNPWHKVMDRTRILMKDLLTIFSLWVWTLLPQSGIKTQIYDITTYSHIHVLVYDKSYFTSICMKIYKGQILLNIHIYWKTFFDMYLKKKITLNKYNILTEYLKFTDVYKC